jgi:DNA-binding CsgD family transcriptional regulator
MDDPLFCELLHKPRFLHTRELIDEQEWIKHPLCHLMSRWRLRYSIAAPLIAAGRLAGTINFARCGRGYYDRASLDRARFLCGEVAFAFERVTHLRRLENDAIANHSITCAHLPERTRQVLELAASGAGNRAISERLCISENTVRDHIKRGYALLSVSNRAQLARCVYGGGSSVSAAGSRESTATL